MLPLTWSKMALKPLLSRLPLFKIERRRHEAERHIYDINAAMITRMQDILFKVEITVHLFCHFLSRSGYRFWQVYRD